MPHMVNGEEQPSEIKVSVHQDDQQRRYVCLKAKFDSGWRQVHCLLGDTPNLGSRLVEHLTVANAIGDSSRIQDLAEDHLLTRQSPE